MEAFWIWTKAKVNSIDMFSKPVSLTYQGREKFTTFLGGVLSALLTIGFVSYGMQLSIQMLTRSATSKAKNSIERDQILVSDYYNFSHEDLAFAVFIATDDSFVPFVDPSYFNVTVAQLSYSYDFKSGALNADLKEESMAICRENFPLLDHKLDDFRNFFSQISYCPTQTDFSVGGSVFFNTLKTVQIKVRRWVNGTSVVCKSKEEIEAKARDLTVTFIVSSKYFDFDDFETPIKRVVDDQFIFKMSSGLKKFSELYVKRSTVALSDSLFPLGEDKEDSFLTIDNYQKDQETRDMSDPIFIDLEIRQDSIVDSYERRVYSVLDLSGQLGGFFEVLAVLGGVVIHYFSSKTYKYSLFEQLYWVETNKAQNKNNDLQISPKRGKRVLNNRDSKFNTKSILEKIETKINSLRRYDFSVKDYFKSWLPFFKTKSRADFTLLRTKLNEEWDLPSILCSIRQLKTLLKLVLKEHQLLMMNFDWKNNYLNKDDPNLSLLKPGDFANSVQKSSNITSARAEDLLEKLKSMDEDIIEHDANIILGVSPLPRTTVERFRLPNLLKRDNSISIRKQDSAAEFFEEEKNTTNFQSDLAIYKD